METCPSPAIPTSRERPHDMAGSAGISDEETGREQGSPMSMGRTSSLPLTIWRYRVLRERFNQLPRHTRLAGSWHGTEKALLGALSQWEQELSAKVSYGRFLATYGIWMSPAKPLSREWIGASQTRPMCSCSRSGIFSSGRCMPSMSKRTPR